MDEQQITSLAFPEALRAVKCGKGVRREGWNEKGLTVFMQVSDSHSKMTLPYLYIQYPERWSTPEATCPWLPSQTDIMAEDWMIV